MSHHHHRDRELDLFAKWFGLFLLVGGICWLIAVTYGTILLPVIASVWLYKRKTGRWPGRKQQAVKLVYKGETQDGRECPHKHTTPGLARECAGKMERRAQPVGRHAR